MKGSIYKCIKFTDAEVDDGAIFDFSRIAVSSESREKLMDAIESIMRDAKIDIDSDPLLTKHFKDIAKNILVAYIESVRRRSNEFAAYVAYPDESGVYPNGDKAHSRMNNDEVARLIARHHITSKGQSMESGTTFFESDICLPPCMYNNYDNL